MIFLIFKLEKISYVPFCIINCKLFFIFVLVSIFNRRLSRVLTFKLISFHNSLHTFNVINGETLFKKSCVTEVLKSTSVTILGD